MQQFPRNIPDILIVLEVVYIWQTLLMYLKMHTCLKCSDGMVFRFLTWLLRTLMKNNQQCSLKP